ncbi:helix-turn-helix domain-containing protein [Trinickia sp.]|uniref:helix-turn-helix domain-containing protein n=1 Tax=Trinickia sp. TaxID=2571163 RepID=UPI003F806B97
MDTVQRVVLMVDRIRVLMRQQGLSDADLARRTGISPATLSRVLSMATEDPRISTVLAIAEALGSTVGYLLHSERAYPVPILEWDEMMEFARGKRHVAGKTQWLSVDTPRRPGAFAARTTPAMAPRFREGSVVLIEPGIALRDAQVVAAAVDRARPTLMRVLMDGEVAWLKPLKPLTPHHPSRVDMINAQARGVTILGVVTESRLVNP